MLSTMQDIPLSVSRILDFASTVHGRTKVTTWVNNSASETTFHEIGARAAALAHALHDELGITGDQRVGTMMFNCAEHLEALFGVASMGAVFTPLNKQLDNDQIHHIVVHSHMEVIIADPRLAEQLAEVIKDAPRVRAVVFIGVEVPSTSFDVDVYSYETLLDGRETVYDWPVQDEREAAALCYSTGTEGAPKGVAYSHRALYLDAMQLRTSDSMNITHGETFLCCVPIYHVLSWGVPFAAFMSGTPLVLPDDDISAPTLARIIAATHPRVAHGVPTVWTQLIVHYVSNPPARMSLTEIYVGGSPASPALIKIWEQKYGVDVIHGWGMTETTATVTVARPPSGASGEARWAYRISQGRFPANVQYRVVNDGKVVSKTDRNQGEIQVRGNLVTSHYYHSDEPTSFRGEPVTDATEMFTADGWLRTGDVGSVTSDGYLTVNDRARDVIRSGGEWIYSATVENEIMEMSGVVECAVIGYPDKKWGERPLAVTVLYSNIEPSAQTAQELHDAMSQRLPSWMIPEYWAFVKTIDKTSVFKFDKKDLRKHLAAGELDVITLAGPGSSDDET